jgi:U3 small nucleolar RNA-associated protein 5
LQTFSPWFNETLQLPDLVARLSGLHATLTSRLALQEGLLTLSGRLEVVLSQIEARSSAAPAPLTIQKGKEAANKPKRAANRYIEGESEDEDDPMDVVIEMEDGDEAGSIEDVELGGDSEDGATESSEEEEEDEEEDEDEGDDEDDDSEPEGPRLNGFIDDEAEETEGDEEDDESE